MVNNYFLIPLTRNEFYGISARSVISAIPRNFFLQSLNNDDSQLFLYPKPNANYQISLQVKTAVDNLTLYTPITQLPPYYQQYLVYLLASELVNYRPSSVWNDKKEARWQELKAKIQGATDLDLNIITMTARNRRNNGAVTILTGGV